MTINRHNLEGFSSKGSSITLAVIVSLVLLTVPGNGGEKKGATIRRSDFLVPFSKTLAK